MRLNHWVIYVMLVSSVATAQPTITSFAPPRGSVGSSVVITGNNFSSTIANNNVFFGGIRANVTAASTTSLTVTVPPGVSFQPISVIVNNLIAVSAKPFSVTFNGGGSLLDILSKPVTFDTSRDPKRVLSVDLDSDGKSDVLTISDVANILTVFRNTTVGQAVSFATKQEFTTGASNPRQFAVGDINSDGLPDVAISHCCSNIITVFINNSTSGSISFLSKADFNLSNASEISLGDMDGDGKLDILAGVLNQLNVYRNTSTGSTISFAAGVNFPIGMFPVGMVVSDFDGDNKVDVAVALYNDNQITLLRNTSTSGTINFAAKQDFASGVNPFALTTADFDGDGKLDLATPNYGLGSGKTVSVFLNTSSSGTIAFAAKNDLDIGQQSLIDVDAGDLDGDGRIDLIVTNTAFNFLLRNISTTGSISFSSPVTYDDFSSHATIADIDNNGKPDLLKVKDALVMIRRNQLLEPQITTFSPSQGGPGTVVSITGVNFIGTSSVKFGGVAAQSFTVLSSNSISAIVGAGNTGDLSVTTPEGIATMGNFNFYTGATIQSFTPRFGSPNSIITLNGQNFSPSVADNIVRFGSIKAEVITASPTVITVKVPSGGLSGPLSITTTGLTSVTAMPFAVSYVGKANGMIFSNSFGLKVDFPTETGQDFIAGGDFDNDGKTDLLTIGSGSNTFSVFRNTGTAGSVTFAARATFPTGNQPVAAAVADLDFDGKPDVVVTNSASNSVSIFKNTSSVGSISFNPRLDVVTATNPQGLAIGDLDGDGRLDIATSNFTGSNQVSLIRNTTTASGLSFATKIDVTASGSFPSAIAINDLNGDQKADLIVANSNSSSVSLFRNIGSAGLINFSSPSNLFVQNFPISLAVSDFNQDNKPDIAVAASSSGTINVFTNTTNGDVFSFTPSVLSGNVNVNHIAVGDLSGDGRLDLAVASSTTTDNKISVFRNSGLSGFDTKIDYSTNTQPVGSVICDFDGDGLTDLASVNRGSNTVSILRNLLATFTSFTPSIAPSGATITITGSNFTGTTGVSFGGSAAASFTVVSPTTITAVVGVGSSGAIAITTPGGVVTLDGFSYLPPPTITSFSPQEAGVGMEVSILGANLDGATSVTFGGIASESFTVVSSTSIKAKVGTGATGNVVITTPNGSGTLAGFVFNRLITALEDETKAFSVFPNPVETNKTTIQLSREFHQKEVNISLISPTGNAIDNRTLVYNHDTGIIYEMQVTPAIYLLLIISNQKQYIRKIVVR